MDGNKDSETEVKTLGELSKEDIEDMTATEIIDILKKYG